ncbi:MAG: hypothetical protein QNJ70_09030 [Xenococcaceae cyanobacterium MO_207.B15]|nr:hypothetical protein [Xenococcaceae cyanobacterium MO_207.B15]MDJ0741806.1 hypothetical protein [Xenococcaceae cyanobacterium MO_167.B27]
MAIIALKAWYLEQYEPIREVIKKPCDLRLSRNSLLKTGMRADFLNERREIEISHWFSYYLEGVRVEFYIEGSGFYVISNIDLVSQEIYFTKQESLSGLEPIIYYSPQTEYPTATGMILPILETTIAQLSSRSRVPLKLEIAYRPQDSPLRISRSQLRNIRKSLLYIADTTPITTVVGENHTSILLSPNTCVEIGYAMESKDNGQILLLRMERSDISGKFPFDVSGYKELSFKNESGLEKTLPGLIATLLQRFAILTH